MNLHGSSSQIFMAAISDWGGGRLRHRRCQSRQKVVHSCVHGAPGVTDVLRDNRKIMISTMTQSSLPLPTPCLKAELKTSRAEP